MMLTTPPSRHKSTDDSLIPLRPPPNLIMSSPLHNQTDISSPFHVSSLTFSGVVISKQVTITNVSGDNIPEWSNGAWRQVGEDD